MNKMIRKRGGAVRPTPALKGFTLIELIVVMAIIAILVLLAAPRYLGKTNDAVLTQIKSDVRGAELKITEMLSHDRQPYSLWDEVSDDELNELISTNSLYNRGGQVEDMGLGVYRKIPNSFVDREINSSLPGTFYANHEGDVVYHGQPNLDTETHAKESDKDIDVTFPEYYVEATDEDFMRIENDWSSPNGEYYYLYIGEDDYVIVPDVIHDDVINDTYHMFGDHINRTTNEYTQSTVQGVAMNNANITDTSEMFFGSVAESLELDYLNTSNVTNMTKMFQGIETSSLDLSSLDTANVTTMHGMFAFSTTQSLDLSHFDTSQVTDMSSLFENAQATSINVDGFDTSNVVNMAAMFRGVNASVNMTHFDTSRVQSMNSMFYSYRAPSIDVSSFDTTNVTDMSFMFISAQPDVLDLGTFNTAGVTTMQSMFNGAKATDINLSSFDTTNVTNMQRMFSNSAVPTLDLSSFDLSETSVNFMLLNVQSDEIYARTQEDASIMEQHFVNKPNTAIVTVKE